MMVPSSGRATLNFHFRMQQGQGQDRQIASPWTPSPFAGYSGGGVAPSPPFAAGCSCGAATAANRIPSPFADSSRGAAIVANWSPSAFDGYSGRSPTPSAGHSGGGAIVANWTPYPSVDDSGGGAPSPFAEYNEGAMVVNWTPSPSVDDSGDAPSPSAVYSGTAMVP